MVIEKIALSDISLSLKGHCHGLTCAEFKSAKNTFCSNGNLKLLVQFWYKLQCQCHEAEKKFCHCDTTRSWRSELEKVSLIFPLWQCPFNFVRIKDTKSPQLSQMFGFRTSPYIYYSYSSSLIDSSRNKCEPLGLTRFLSENEAYKNQTLSFFLCSRRRVQFSINILKASSKEIYSVWLTRKLRKLWHFETTSLVMASQN